MCSLKVIVDGRRPCCYACGIRGHRRTPCLKHKPLQSERAVEKDEDAVGTKAPRDIITDRDSKIDMECARVMEVAESKKGRTKAKSEGSNGFVVIPKRE